VLRDSRLRRNDEEETKMGETISRELINQIRGTKVVPGVCTLCPWRCATEVYVRDNKVIYVRGNEYSANKTSLCVKGISSAYLPRDPKRLLHPMRRNSNGVFDRISWDEALTYIAEKLLAIKEKDGPEAVGYFWHHDSNPMFSLQLFTQLYGTPNWSGHGAACDQDRRLASETLFGHPLLTKDYSQSRFIMLWGVDPFGANEALYENRELMEALQRGAKLVVVDPVRSRTAERAHVWLPVRPGTDGALALAMAHRIVETRGYDQEFCSGWLYGFQEFAERVQAQGYTPEWAKEVTGIDQQTIIQLADEFAATRPALMDGLEGLVNYSNGLDAFRTIYTLNAMTGNVDGPGNIILKEPAPLEMPIEIPEKEIVTPERTSLSEAMGYPLAPHIPTRLLPLAAIEHQPYPMKAAFFHIINPAMSEPNSRVFEQMMEVLDLSVTIDLYMTETAQRSDIVLPEASMYERAEVREGLWSGPQVILSQPAIPPVGESKPIYEIMKGLAEKLGYGEYYKWDSWEDWGRRMTQHLPISFEELKEKGCWQGDLAYHKYREEGFRTSSGRIEVSSDTLKEAGYDPLPAYTEAERVLPDEEYPFQLVNAKMQFHCNVQAQNNPYLLGIEDENRAELNPRDAQALDILDGDRIEIASPQHKAVIAVRLREAVQPGVVKVIDEHGFGRRNGGPARGKGTQVNPISETRANPISGEIGYNECKVSIRKSE
jgi:thiosulfate reductase/polysulfide reductase chain A